MGEINSKQRSPYKLSDIVILRTKTHKLLLTTYTI